MSLSMMTLRTSRALLVALCLLFAAPPAFSELTAIETVQGIVDQTVSILRSGLSREAKRTKISEIADKHLAFETMARLTLARNWKTFSADEQTEFVTEFQIFLGKSYGRKFDQYQDEEVKILGQRDEPRDDMTVQTKLLRSGGEEIAIDYRLRRSDTTWRVIDVTIEGVSLVSSYRSQFKELLHDGSPEDLLQQIREKNAQPQSD